MHEFRINLHQLNRRRTSNNNFKNGDKTYNKWEGTHETIVKEGGVWEVSYEGKFDYTVGTGKFKNIKGGGTYKGTWTAIGITEEGEFEAEY